MQTQQPQPAGGGRACLAAGRRRPFLMHAAAHPRNPFLAPRKPANPASCLAICRAQEDYRPQAEELSFLQDAEQNDGRIMLFQLPAPLPIAQQTVRGCWPGCLVFSGAAPWLRRPCVAGRRALGQAWLLAWQAVAAGAAGGLCFGACSCTAHAVRASQPPPTLLPPSAATRAQAAAPDGAGSSVAASRPASLREVPSSRIGKLLVFESGKVKLQVGWDCFSRLIGYFSCFFTSPVASWMSSCRWAGGVAAIEWSND